MLIIDALRYDFIAPPPPAGTVSDRVECGWKADPFCHNVLTLPAEFTGKHGTPAMADKPGPRSWVAHFAADPPTTTLQRLKGLTTGTLPTFIEAGANFGSAGTGVGVVREDNWISQFRSHLLSQSPKGRAGLVFAGDDTWSTTFPGLFDNDALWTYPSFNVEDLDSVDRGVEEKLLPFLQPHHPERATGVHDKWGLLVGHMLGVDHVGHRFGASHPRMKTKLLEMQEFLKNITEALDEETLLVVMGDHGMDERGDHGGDGELEVGAGIWIYAKSGFGFTGRKPSLRLDPATYLSTPNIEALLPSRIPFSPLPSPPYPSEGHRSIPQIDLVPTLSVLLGLPIPHSNLGSIIPDLFPHPHTLLRALRITAIQMRKYLNTYAASSPDLAAFKGEFDGLWLKAIRADARLAAELKNRKAGQGEVEELWREASQAYHAFNRVSLVRAREVWAQFDNTRIFLGLVVLVMGLAVTWMLRWGSMHGLTGSFPNASGSIETRVSVGMEELWIVVYECIFTTGLAGAAAGIALYFASRFPPFSSSLTLLDCTLAGASISSAPGLLVNAGGADLKRSLGLAKDGENEDIPTTTKALNWAGWFVLLLHAILFASNSFLINEDSFSHLCLSLLILFRGLLSIGTAPNTRSKVRLAFLSLLSLLLLRLARIPRICREEQGPQCSSYFFAGDGGLNSPYIMALSYTLAYLLPGVLGRFLGQSKSFVGIAVVFFNWVLRPTLMLGAGYWVLDWAAPLEWSKGWGLEGLKGWVATVDLVVLCVLALAFWIFAPLCLEIKREEGEEEGKVKVTILGYANSLGSSYLLLVGLVVSVLWIVTQPAGQLALGLGMVAAMGIVEIGDAERDHLLLFRQRAAIPPPTPSSKKSKLPPAPTEPVEAAPSKPVFLSSAEIASFALLGYTLFFATGHQPTFPSIQWRVAFLTSPTLSYPLSPLLVALNSFGHLCLLPPLFTTLAVLWNVAPLPRGSNRRMHTPAQVLHGLLGLALYNGILLVSVGGLAGVVFKRHLMLFKVWVPRVLLQGVASVVGQVGGLGAVLGAWQVGNKVNAVFGSEFA